MVSNEGGVEIEEVARSRPEAIRRLHVDAALGLRGYHARRLSGHLPAEAREGAAALLAKMYAVLADIDATLVEVNPFVLLTDGTVMALDAKVTIDDNALFRQPEIEALRDSFPIDPIEKRAKDAGTAVREARGRGRDHRQRRGARDVDARRRGAGRRACGELPRRRRRGERGGRWRPRSR